MALNIPSSLIAEKNKLFSGGAFLELLKIVMSENSQTLRIVNNNEDVIWDGQTWQKFQFQAGDFSESNEGETPQVTVKVSNILRAVQGHVENTDKGLVGDVVSYYLIHSDNLLENTPVISQNFTILGVKCDENWVEFLLGAENFFLRAFPINMYKRMICRYKSPDGFKGIRCGYSGGESLCDRTFSTCISYGNQARFGGQPSIPGGFFDV